MLFCLNEKQLEGSQWQDIVVNLVFNLVFCTVYTKSLIFLKYYNSLFYTMHNKYLKYYSKYKYIVILKYHRYYCA